MKIKLMSFLFAFYLGLAFCGANQKTVRGEEESLISKMMSASEKKEPVTVEDINEIAYAFKKKEQADCGENAIPPCDEYIAPAWLWSGLSVVKPKISVQELKMIIAGKYGIPINELKTLSPKPALIPYDCEKHDEKSTACVSVRGSRYEWNPIIQGECKIVVINAQNGDFLQERTCAKYD